MFFTKVIELSSTLKGYPLAIHLILRFCTKQVSIKLKKLSMKICQYIVDILFIITLCHCTV